MKLITDDGLVTYFVGGNPELVDPEKIAIGDMLYDDKACEEHVVIGITETHIEIQYDAMRRAGLSGGVNMIPKTAVNAPNFMWTLKK